MKPVIAATAFILLALWPALQGVAAPAPIVIATGPVSSFSFPLGGEICKLFELTTPDKARCLVAVSSGSVDDIKRLRAGEIGLAIVQSDVAADAINATGAFSGNPPFADLRSIVAFYTDALTLLVRNDGDVKKPEDLKGKRIAIGEKNVPDPLFADFLEGMGWAKADLGGIVEMAREDQIAALCSGKIAAIAIAAPHPNGFVREALSACPIVALDIAGSVIDSAVSAHPAYAPVHINMGIYGRAAYSIQSFGPRAVAVTTVKLDHDIVTRLLDGLFLHLEELEKAHPAFADLDKKILSSGLGLGAERHPAVAKYMTDKKIVESPTGE